MKVQVWSTEDLRVEFPFAEKFGQIIDSVQMTVTGRGEVVCEVTVNGAILTEDDEARFSECSINEISELRIKSQAPIHLINESLVSCREYAGKLADVLEQGAHLFREDDIDYAHEFNFTCIESARWFVEMITHFKQAYQQLICPLPNEWLDHELKMMRCLTQILAAYERKDYILVADLIEYELIEIFTRWQSLLTELEQAQGRGQPIAEITT